MEIKQLCRIMGSENVFVPDDWRENYARFLNKKEMKEAMNFPWGEDVLNEQRFGGLVKDNHAAFLGISNVFGKPITAVGLSKLHPFTIGPQFEFDHAGQPQLDTATLELRWYLVLREVVPGSVGLSQKEQTALLPKEYECPTVVVELTKGLIFNRKLNAHFNPGTLSACGCRTVGTKTVPPDRTLCVGHSRAEWITVAHWDGSKSSCVGIGASRRIGL